MAVPPGVIGQWAGESIIETGGQVMEARSRAIVHVSPGGSSAKAILNALADPDVPADGESYAVGFTDVRVADRRGRVIGTSPTNLAIVEVDIFYLWMPTTPYVSSGGTSVYTKRSIFDKEGDEITLTHNSVVQTTPVNVLRPTSNMTITVFYQNIGNPINITKLWVGMVNSHVWAGGDELTWFCKGAPHEKVTNITSPTNQGWRRFDFEFEYRSEGWKQETNFFDPAIGMMPGTIDAGGKKTIDVYGTADFRNLVPLA